jgi:MFS family permease
MDRRLFILWLTIFIDLLGFSIFIPVVPYFAKELNASDTVITMSAAVFSVMVFLFSPIWGSISDRYGRRPVILAAIAISAMSYVIFAHANAIWLLFASRILTGVGSGNIAATQAYVSDITPPQDRAKRIGLIVGASFGMAFAFGPAIGGIIFHRFGIEAVGYFATALCLLNLVGVLAFLPESLKVKDPSRPINFRPVASTFASLKDTRFRDIFLIGFVYITAFSMMNVTISLLWKDRFSLTVEQTGLMFSLVGILSAISQGGLVGVFNRYLGERRMMIYGCVLVGLGLAVIPFVPVGLRDASGAPIPMNWVFLACSLVSMIMLSIGNACLNPSLVSILSRKADPHEQGEVMGQNQGFSSLARVLGPAMAGPLYELGHGLPFWVGGAIMLGTLWLVFDYLRTNYTPIAPSPAIAD